MSEMKLIEFHARLRLLEAQRGGRTEAVKPGAYRPLFRIGNTTAECQIVEIDKDLLAPGEEGRCRVQVLDLNGLSILLKRGADFQLLEGNRVVGAGRIIDQARSID
jgi:translation elongation factor EF-Tu-like GTPase